MSKRPLSINLVTRGRPDHLIWTVERTLPNISRDDTVLMISVDSDDDATIAALDKLPSDPRIRPIIKDREDSLGAKYNRILIEPAEIYMIMVDYGAHVTKGFDQRVIDAGRLFPDNIGVVYNYLANASFPSLNAVTHGLVEKMGWVYPPFFPYWFVDHWLDDIARLIDRISFADVVVEQLPKPGTQEYREPVFWSTFFDLSHLMRRRCARSIIDGDDFQEPGWRKEILRRHYPLVEYRSQWVNNVVREESKTARVAGPGDDRYARLRSQAQGMAAVMFDEFNGILKTMEAA